jgi:hypothetical protein
MAYHLLFCTLCCSTEVEPASACTQADQGSVGQNTLLKQQATGSVGGQNTDADSASYQ